MNILDKIVEQRKKDIADFGFSLGFDIPSKRSRPVTPFLTEKGAILEVKRASPSKGDIAPDLDASKQAEIYAEAGAKGISVLTESHWFKGNLVDLLAACSAVDEWAAKKKKNPPAILRKDFLLYPEEIEIAYRCGADAVLLIARILEKDLLMKMVAKCAELKIRAFVEVRLQADIDKVIEADMAFPGTVLAGVNSRDLADFTIDPLKPAEILEEMKVECGKVLPTIYESGLSSVESVQMAGKMGFHGILLGEAAARNPKMAADFAKAIDSSSPDPTGDFWRKVANRIYMAKKCGRLPLVKICGITNEEDGIKAFELGADFLGFIFCKKSPRKADLQKVRDTVEKVRAYAGGLKKSPPLFIGVITEIGSTEGKEAVKLVKEGFLDAIQFHGFSRLSAPDVPGYTALNLSGGGDIEILKKELSLGQPRVLVDAKSGDLVGGTGKTIAANLVNEAAKCGRLWLAGGIGPENVRQIVDDCTPELIDASSLLEEREGKKDFKAMEEFFKKIKG